MTLTATPQPTNDPPRVLLSVDANLGGSTVSVVRLDPDGRTRPVRGGDPGTITAEAWTGFDYEAPFGAPVTYSAIPTIGAPELLTPNQSGLETDTTGWAPNDANTTLTRSTAQAWGGVASLAITAVASGTCQATTPTGTAGMPVTAGENYTATARFRAATQFRPVYAVITWYNAAGGAVAGTINGTPINDSATGWTFFTVSGVAPATTAYARVVLTVSSPAAGEVHYVDDIHFFRTKGAAQVSAPVTLAVTDPWLIHPGIPDLSLAIPADSIESVAPRTRAARAAVLQPLGRSTPVVVSEARAAPATGLELTTDTSAARDALNDLLADGSALLLNLPPALGWGFTYEWIAVGDTVETAIAGGNDFRRFSLPYSVVDRPVGGVVAQWAWSDVLTYSTWADVMAAYDTYAELLANTP